MLTSLLTSLAPSPVPRNPALPANGPRAKEALDDSPRHEGKSGRYERLRERAFDYSFNLWQLGVEAPAPR